MGKLIHSCCFINFSFKNCHFLTLSPNSWNGHDSESAAEFKCLKSTYYAGHWWGRRKVSTKIEEIKALVCNKCIFWRHKTVPKVKIIVQIAYDSLKRWYGHWLLWELRVDTLRDSALLDPLVDGMATSQKHVSAPWPLETVHVPYLEKGFF